MGPGILSEPQLIEREMELERYAAEASRSAPSLPIILISASLGVAAAIAAFFLGHEVARLSLEWSVAVSVLALCFGLGVSGALLSSITGSRAALANISLSCLAVALVLLFFGSCLVLGALAATFLISSG
jgi:VIT1/CCC1 family predicted Fe2+/Mn2+ transporter